VRRLQLCTTRARPLCTIVVRIHHDGAAGAVPWLKNTPNYMIRKDKAWLAREVL
jgi:hypothetical protein